MHKNSNPIEIGSRREPIVDHFLIDHLDGVRLALQKPRDEGPVLRRDKPWEGLMGYFTVIKDGDTYRTYYRGDCNDGISSINPAATEICDGLDNDCAGGAHFDPAGETDNDGDGDRTAP